ncbi:MAG: hypothetical protein Ct9H300mP21_07310 [Pseudomonadota bacterium]|nr:MAG: hypothetical protein Ct9H300mP21_07310 [Pseudomonadota bacterium]
MDELILRTPEELERSVILLQDAFTSFYESQVVMDFYELLKQLGYTVYVAPFSPNGKPLHVKGFLKQFRKVVEKNTNWLSYTARCGIPLVGLDPSVVLTYRDEYLKVIEEIKLPFEVLLPQEFLLKK